MLGELRDLYFSFDGQLRRFPFFKRSIYLGIFDLVLVTACIPLLASGYVSLWWIALTALICVHIVSLGAETSLVVRRLHDMGLSGYHAIWVVGAELLWAAISRGPTSAVILGLPLLAINLWILFWPGQTKQLPEPFASECTPLNPDAWYYADRMGQSGPLTLQELREVARTFSSDYLSEILVWHQGLSDWKRITDIADINLQTPPPPPPLASSATVNGTKESPVRFGTQLLPKSVDPIYPRRHFSLGLLVAVMKAVKYVFLFVFFGGGVASAVETISELIHGSYGDAPALPGMFAAMFLLGAFFIFRWKPGHD